ncbi:TPA: ead/Ea22-like family protein [Klebsiella variicola subsp. variicola]|nr:ead/Ea22-like family protein [Klebsiella variicola subsp. variicola]
MTTDITELAQSMKAAAIDAKELAIIARYSKGRAAAEKFYALANPNNIIALVEALEKSEKASEARREAIDRTFNMFVRERDRANAAEEALEKARQVDEELCRLLPPGAEYMDPPDGGDVTLLEGVRRMVADYRQRIAELESRAVKLPKKNIGWDRDEEDCWNNAIDACAEVLAAAGIKVEAE